MTPEEEKWFENPERFRVQMEGRWDLADLYEFPHAFEQCYSFIYCFDTDVEPANPQNVVRALRALPWKGGYSYVNLYLALRREIKCWDRPRVSELKYASPGWIELSLNLGVAIEVAKAVAAISVSAALSVKSYKAASKYLTDLKTAREKAKVADLKLTVEQDAALMKLCEIHAKFMGFKSVRALTEKTGNPAVTLQLLLAHHRRLRNLAKFQEENKAILLPSSPNS